MDHISFMKESGIAVFVEADRKTGVVRMEKLGDLENWDLFQQLVLYSDADTLCDSSGSHFPYQVWGQGGTGCLLSWLSDGRAAVLFFDSQLSGKAQIDWVQELDKRCARCMKQRIDLQKTVEKKRPPRRAPTSSGGSLSAVDIWYT